MCRRRVMNTYFTVEKKIHPAIVQEATTDEERANARETTREAERARIQETSTRAERASV